MIKVYRGYDLELSYFLEISLKDVLLKDFEGDEPTYTYLSYFGKDDKNIGLTDVLCVEFLSKDGKWRDKDDPKIIGLRKAICKFYSLNENQIMSSWDGYNLYIFLKFDEKFFYQTESEFLCLLKKQFINVTHPFLEFNKNTFSPSRKQIIKEYNKDFKNKVDICFQDFKKKLIPVKKKP